MMKIWTKSECEKCLNRNGNGSGCCWRKAYESSIQSVNNFLAKNNDVDFYGSITARCDYFFADPDKQEKVCRG